MLNVPNALSLFRLILVGVFYYVFNLPDRVLALVIYLVAGATDILDGYIARKYNLITNLGKLLDPLADKLMLAVAMYCLYSIGYVPLFFLIYVIVKELAMVLASAVILTKQHVVVYAKTIGKVSTLVFTLGVVLSFFAPDMGGFHLVVLWIGVGCSVAAVFSYGAEYLVDKKKQPREN